MRYRILLFLLTVVACTNTMWSQETDTIALVDPGQVFVVEEDTAEITRLAAYRLIAGQWQYSKPYVHADGSSLIGKLGKPIAKSKLKKNLDKAYKKFKLKSRWNSMILTDDGAWEMRVLGLPLKGRYTYEPDAERLTLKWNGIPLKSHVHRDGSKLYIAFDTDRLLVILHLLSGLSHSQTLKSLSFLSQNFRDVMVGFEMKATKD